MTNTAMAVSSASVELDPEILRTLRQDAGLTQVELAELAGIGRKYVSDLETGYRARVSPPTYVRLCDALKIPASNRSVLRKSRQIRTAA